MRTLAIVLLALALPCCGRKGDDEAALRRAFSDMRDASVKRDYAAMWDLVDSGSRERLSKQLRNLQGLEETDPFWAAHRKTFGLSREDLLGLDTRQYFLAILNGLDRAQPELRERQIEENRGREIVSIRIDGATAEMKTKTTSGAVETFNWVNEGGDWRCKADVAE